jgi:hypothetical protein
MYEADDRLAGDPVWELFPAEGPGAPTALRGHGSSWAWVVGAAVLVALGLTVFPTLAVATVCLAVAWGDFARGRKFARSFPDKAIGTVCSRFHYGWGLWKLGMTAVVLMFGSVAFIKKDAEPPAALFAALVLVMIGFTASAVVTASGLFVAFRNGMRVWVGEGINRARTLLMAMLLVGFTIGILIPVTMVLGAWAGRGTRIEDEAGPFLLMLVLFGFMFGAPVALLLLLDWISRRVIADRPGKFGAKVPTVGKWSA